jgi:hypothetical protein
MTDDIRDVIREYGEPDEGAPTALAILMVCAGALGFCLLVAVLLQWAGG